MVTYNIECLIEIEAYDICHEDMTGKRGGECYKMRATWLIY